MLTSMSSRHNFYLYIQKLSYFQRCKMHQSSPLLTSQNKWSCQFLIKFSTFCFVTANTLDILANTPCDMGTFGRLRHLSEWPWDSRCQCGQSGEAILRESCGSTANCFTASVAKVFRMLSPSCKTAAFSIPLGRRRLENAADLRSP